MIYLAFGKKYRGNVYGGPWKGYSVLPVGEEKGATSGKPPFRSISLQPNGSGFDVMERELPRGTLEYEKVLKRVSSERGGNSKNKSHRNLLSNAQNGYKPRCLVTREQLIRLLENNHAEF